VQNGVVTTIGFLSLVGLPYPFEFLWAPLLDRLDLPWLGRRRGWLVLTQLALAGTLLLLAGTSPASATRAFAPLAVAVAFMSASQDVVIVAYRTDLLPALERVALERVALGAQLRQFKQHRDLLVTPAVAVPAFDARPAGTEQLTAENMLGWTPFSYPFNLSQQPACSIPCGLTKAGLPNGLQIVGPMFGDALVLRAARAYEPAKPIVRPRVEVWRRGSRLEPVCVRQRFIVIRWAPCACGNVVHVREFEYGHADHPTRRQARSRARPDRKEFRAYQERDRARSIAPPGCRAPLS
jgi:hypothetical protein